MNVSEVITSSSELGENQCRVSVRLLDLMKRTHYDLIQENGQRRLTAPELTKEYRESIKGAEVFLGRLPRDCYEDELMPVLESIGRLLELRLMLDFSGSTRGYAFALFEDSKTAKRACDRLNGYQLRPGHRIGVVKSIDNCRLFFGGVPKDKTKEDFAQELGKMLDGISEIYLYPNAQDRTQNRGFIFVEFKDHRSAAMARRKLIPGRVVLWDHEIAVDWADPEPGDPIDDEVMENVTALFVRNLPMDLPHQKVRDILQKSTGINILKLKKINHFAFVHYETRELAQRVFDIMNVPGGIAEQKGWEIRWAKPIGASKQIERQRSIHEAITGIVSDLPAQPGHRHGNKRANMKKRGKLPESQSPEIDRTLPPTVGSSPEITPGLLMPVPNHPPPIVNIDYHKILDEFVAKKWSAQCHYMCIQVYAPSGFICKISVLRENQLFFDYQGNIQMTQALAVNVTAREVYYRLSGNILEPSMFSAPTYPSNYLPNRVEACH